MGVPFPIMHPISATCWRLGHGLVPVLSFQHFLVPSFTWWISPFLSVVENPIEGSRVRLALTGAGKLPAALRVTGVWLASFLETTALVIRIQVPKVR